MNKKISLDLSVIIANLPSLPGVYRMLDHDKNVLYVGKAGNLKKRVSSYFNKQNIGAKTQSLVRQIVSIEVSITQSETEALLLESNLIKTLRPKYNVLLRDDKSYPYIHVSTHPFPRMELYRSKRKPKKGEFYGPFPSVAAVRETLNTIQKVFKIRDCQDSYFSARSRPCLQYQIKRCSAPCTQLIGPQAYQQAINDARRFLQGKCNIILDELALRMENAVRELNFEEAAILRDQIKHLRLIQEQQGIAQMRGDADAIVIEARPGFACIQCITIREGQVINSQSFFPMVPEQEFFQTEANYAVLWQEVFEAFVGFYYLDTPNRIPPLIVTHHTIDNRVALQTMLSEIRGKPCQIQINPRGNKARWIEFAQNNLALAVASHNTSAQTMRNRYQALTTLLNTAKPIERMECFDISHTQGELTVASCVVFDNQGPKKSEYRRFNIQGIPKGDDYKALDQAVFRRFKRLLEMNDLPDVLIIDGGKGQINAVKKTLNQLKIEEVILVGIAKGPERKAGLEHLILSTQSQEIHLPMDSQALHLLQHIRDEAHRFAITTHRKKRDRVSIESGLESIEGVGPKRRQALLRRFGGIRDLAKAPLEEISKVKGISQDLATRIYHYFHP